ncbi:MAG: hypothetical protein ABW321_33195, partial [Polyangiales bacterium]
MRETVSEELTVYIERPITSAIAAAGRCSWISVVQHDGPSRVVPDACMDVIFRGGRLEFAGIDTRPMPVQLGRG